MRSVRASWMTWPSMPVMMPRAPSEPSSVVMVALRGGAAGPQRAENPVRAGRAEHEVDLAAALAEPVGQREQGRAAVPDADQQAADRLPGQRERAAERADHVEQVPAAAPASHRVPGPPASKTNSIVPPWSARTSWMENARRSSMDGSGPPTAMVTNWPGRKSVAMAGATMVTAW